MARFETIVSKRIPIKLSRHVEVKEKVEKKVEKVQDQPLDEKLKPEPELKRTGITIPKLEKENGKPKGPRIVDTIGYFEWLRGFDMKLWELFRPSLTDPVTGKVKRKGGSMANQARRLFATYNIYYAGTKGF